MNTCIIPEFGRCGIYKADGIKDQQCGCYSVYGHAQVCILPTTAIPTCGEGRYRILLSRNSLPLGALKIVTENSVVWPHSVAVQSALRLAVHR